MGRTKAGTRLNHLSSGKRKYELTGWPMWQTFQVISFNKILI